MFTDITHAGRICLCLQLYCIFNVATATRSLVYCFHVNIVTFNHDNIFFFRWRPTPVPGVLFLSETEEWEELKPNLYNQSRSWILLLQHTSSQPQSNCTHKKAPTTKQRCCFFSDSVVLRRFTSDTRRAPVTLIQCCTWATANTGTRSTTNAPSFWASPSETSPCTITQTTYWR